MKLFTMFWNFYKNQDRWIFFALTLTIIISLGEIALYFINLTKLPGQLPIFYSLPWGDPQLADKSQFLILPALSFLFIFINTTFCWYLHSSQLSLKRILACSTIVLSLLFFTTGFGILSIFT